MNDKQPSEFEFDGPTLTDKTTLKELEEAGASTLGAVGFMDLLRYVRNGCKECANDPGLQRHEDDRKFATAFGKAAERIEEAILALSNV